MIDVKSVYRTHITKRVIDETTVELWCGRISVGGAGKPSRGPTCDSCRNALAFSCGQESRN